MRSRGIPLMTYVRSRSMSEHRAFAQSNFKKALMHMGCTASTMQQKSRGEARVQMVTISQAGNDNPKMQPFVGGYPKMQSSISGYSMLSKHGHVQTWGLHRTSPSSNIVFGLLVLREYGCLQNCC